MEYVEDEFCNKSLDDLINCSIEYNQHLVDANELTPEAVAVPLTFAIIFIVGVTGNVLLILNFARHKKLSTPHNALVVNLAAGDLLILTIGLPFNSLLYTIPEWPFGDLICRLSRSVETLATAVTIATLAVLSVERYFIVTGRRRHDPLSSLSVLVIIAIWVGSFILGLPDLLSATVISFDNGNATANGTVPSLDICFDFNPDWGVVYLKVNIVSKFLLLFLIPLLVIAPCYMGLAFHLVFKMFGSRGTPTSKTPLRAAAAAPPIRHETGDDDSNLANDVKEGNHFRDQRAESSSSRNDMNSASGAQLNNVTNGNSKGKTPNRKRRRLAVTVLGLVLSFVICWLPRHIYLLWFHFDPTPYNHFWHVFKIFGFCLMFSNSAVNPFVFYVLDLRFRAFAHAVLLCKRRTIPPNAGDENGGGGAETAAVEVSMTEGRRTYIAMSEMPTCTERIDSV